MTPTPHTVPLRVLTALAAETPPGPGRGLRLALQQGQGPLGTPEAVRADLPRVDEALVLAARYRAQLCAFPELMPSRRRRRRGRSGSHSGVLR
ncbi:hypothetical protein AB0D16_36925 [Streptomyces sp. NPDC048161]|uniref:hypothetical protein n=1 Tax=unclassified Streptomyces TaxID=2593676 RepID=UPI0033FE1108